MLRPFSFNDMSVSRPTDDMSLLYADVVSEIVLVTCWRSQTLILLLLVHVLLF